MSFLELSKRRHSTRSFCSRPIEEEKLDCLYEVIRNAPTAKNLQPQRVYVLKSEEAIKKANEFSPCMYGAPLAFLVCADLNQAFSIPNVPGSATDDIDATIVATQLALEAEDIGLGSVIVRLFDSEKAKRLLSIPDNIKPVILLPVGYPSPEATVSPRHSDKKPVEELIKVI